MKLLKLCFAIIVTLSANAQSSTYHPLVTNYSNWVYQLHLDPWGTSESYEQFTINSDTTILGTVYKKIFYELNYAGALRENNKIIYIIPDTSSSEYILYNFNLSLGDSIIHPLGGTDCGNDTAIVIAVDSVLASDGYHRSLYFNTFAVWIEGIGSIFNLLAPSSVACLSSRYELMCMNNNSFLYPSNSSPCIRSVLSQSNTSSNTSVFPNPSNGSFTIDLNNPDIKEVRLNDLLGNIIFQQQTIMHQKINIDHLKSGVYFLSFIDKNNRTTTRKIICN